MANEDLLFRQMPHDLGGEQAVLGAMLIDPDKVKEVMLGQISLKRFGEPEDVANAVAFLASDDAAYISGQVLEIDGCIAM